MKNQPSGRKHVMFIAPELGIGGAQTHLIRYANGLDARGYRVTIVTVGSSDKLAKTLRADVACHVLASRMRNPFLWWRLIRLVRQIAPDVLIGWSLYSNFAALAVSFFFRPACLMLVELNYPPALRRTMGPIAYGSVKLLTSWLFPRADVVAANSDEAVEVLRSWAPRVRKCRRVLNPLNFEEIDRLAECDQVPDHLLARKDEVLILAIGRILLVHKGFDTLVRACARLKDIPGWRLFIVGSGPDESELHALIRALGLSDRITHLPAVTNPFPYYKAAHIVALPSRYEGFPNVLFEALALGKATVATDCHSGPREMTANGRYGRIVGVDDDLALANELRDLIQQPETRSRLGQDAKQYAREAYAERRVFDVLISCFDDFP